jgi:hypothetical protein
MRPQFLRQRHNVVAPLQAGAGVLPERFENLRTRFLSTRHPLLALSVPTQQAASIRYVILGYYTYAIERVA